jgi:hypothetical protein
VAPALEHRKEEKKKKRRQRIFHVSAQLKIVRLNLPRYQGH